MAPDSKTKRPAVRMWRVRQFAVPVESFYYKIVFKARDSKFIELEKTFEFMIASVKITPPAVKEGAR